MRFVSLRREIIKDTSNILTNRTFIDFEVFNSEDLKVPKAKVAVLDFRGNLKNFLHKSNVKTIEFNQMSYIKMGKSKSSRSKQVQKSFLYDNKHNKFHDTSKNRQHEKIENKEKFAVSQTKRIDLRRKILKDFHTFCINEETYNDFIGILISLEEDIVNKK